MIGKMGFDLLWVTTCALVVMMISLWFVFHPDRKTGILGTFGLAVLALGAMTRIFSAWHDEDGHISSTLPLFVWTGMAAYLGYEAKMFVNRLRCKERADPTWYDVHKTRISR